MNRHHHGRHRDNRCPSPIWPMVFFAGEWVRSGDSSRYDAYPVLDEPQPPWQKVLAATKGRQSGTDHQTDAA